MSNDNRRKLYDALSQDYDMGTYEQFCKDIQDETKRKKLYDATSEVYDYGDYAKFSSQLGFGQISPVGVSTPTPDQTAEVQSSTENKQEGWKPTPMQKAFMMGSIQSSTNRFKAQTDASLERIKNASEYYNRGGAFSGNKPVKGDMRYNPESGNIEQTYLTPTGTATADKFAAERETRAYNDYVDNMTVSGQLRRAGRDLSDLHRKREERVKAIHDKWAEDQKNNKAPLAAVLGAQTYVPSIQSDPEYRALTAAIHQAEKRVQTLQHENDRQDGKDVGFWRGFGEVVGDIKTWDFGYSGLMDAMTMLDATSKPSPNRPAKTDAQKEAEQIMLEQTYEAQQAQSAYGQNDSFWNRAGVMTGEMLPFMLDFAIMGGAKGGTSMVTRNLDAVLLRSLHKAAPKIARNKAVQWTTKALGAMPEDLLYRAPLMTNTVQGMKTSADIIDRKLGDVVIRNDGTYDFSNNKTWGSAVWQGEANAIIENYSEMFGTHLEGVLSLKTVGKLADTFGAKRLSGILTKASNSELAGIAGTMQKHLNQLGVSDYFGEVGEEYYGQLWRTMLNLDDAYKQNPDGSRTNLFLDGQFHGDIWGGMALSMGLMGAGKYSISAAAYGSMKHRVNKTDTRASEIFTPEVWNGWRERIDGTTNDKIGEMAEAIVADPTLTDEQRTAAMNYMEASLNLRGFNLASVARQRGGEMSEDEAAANESYMDGYSASTPQEMNDAKKMLDLQRGRLASALSEDLVQDFDNDPIGALSVTHDPELRHIASDYVNAKAVYDGMIQRVRDDVDGRIAQSNAMIDSRINRETGMIQPATMKADDRRVYIVNGTVAMFEDGTGVDTNNSSESIIIRDAETGKVEFADPTQFHSVDEAVDAETEKEAARAQIIDEIAVAAANNIDGVLSFTPGESYSVLNLDGNPEDIAILGQPTDENGIPLDGYVDIQYPDGTIQSVATSDLQQWVDVANTRRVTQFADEREARREAQRKEDEEAYNSVAPVVAGEWLIGSGENSISSADYLVKALSGLYPLASEAIERIRVENGERLSASIDDFVSDPSAWNSVIGSIRDNIFAIYNSQEAVDILDDILQYPKGAPYKVGQELSMRLEQLHAENESTPLPMPPGVPNSDENTEIPTENRDLASETVPKTENSVENVQQTADDGFIPIDPELINSRTDENGNIIWDEPQQEQSRSEEHKQSALSRVPLNEKGKPDFGAVDADTAWDAIVEKTSNEAMAQSFADNMVAASEAELKKAEKVKTKPTTDIDEFIAADTERIANIDRAKTALDHWKKVAGTKQRRQAEADAVRNAEMRKRAEEARVKAEQERAEREEAERIEREALNGVPDWSRDTPQDARARGYRRNGPQKVDRQENVASVQGKEIEVKFGDNELPKGHATIIDASTLQPSHIQGSRNPAHFLDEAQPKERDDAASILSAQKIASNIRPEEITSSVTAYTGAPTVNFRGETIQGNSRSDALRLMYESKPEQAAKYRQYLIDHASDFGLTPEQIASVERPVLVNMLDVADDEAIRLGQFVAQDTESGGIERIKPKNAVQKMGNKIRNFANILLRSEDDEASLSQLIEANGAETIKWMSRNGFITDTQYGSAFDSKGELSAKASEDLKGILYQSIFTGGSTRLEEMFSKLPAKAQRAILATAFRDYDSARADRMIEELQQSIIAFYDLSTFGAFADATNLKDALAAVEAWKHQYAMDDVSGESYLPAENFSNFALKLAAIYKGGSQKFIQQTFNDLFDAVQGTAQDTLFEEADKTPKSLAEAIKKVLDLEYQPVKQNDNGHNGSNAVDIDTPQSEAGRPGSSGNADSREREPDSSEPADSGAGTSNDSGKRDDVTPATTTPSTNDEIFTPEEIKAIVGHTFTHSNGDVVKLTGHTIMPEPDSRPAFIGTLNGQKGGRFMHSIVRIFLDKWKHDVVLPTKQEVITTQSKEEQESAIQAEEYALNSRIEVKDDDWTEGGGYTPTLKRTVVIDGTHNVTQVDAPNDKGDYTGSIFEYDGKTFGDLREVISYIDSIDSSRPATIGEQVAEAEAEVNTTPTDGQKKAGNYKKGHVQVGTFDVTIENPKGSKRSGTDPDGKKWETTMTHTYGYILGTKGVDGDHIDVYISSDIDGWNGRKVFVVDQYNPDGSFDEHKVMLGFNDKVDAIQAYLSNYEDGWEKGRRLVFSTVSIEDFEKWIESSHRKQKPFKEYKSVHIEDTHEGGKDELHDEVRQWLGKKGLEPDESSRSAVMRYFKIGYNRAEKILNAIAEENAANQQEEATRAQEQTTSTSTEGYTIVSKPYTNKQGKTLDTHLVTFDRDFSKEEQKRIRAMAKEKKGWPDRETGGYMLRSREDAEEFAASVMSLNAAFTADAPVNLSDIESAIKPAEAEISLPADKPTDAEAKPEKKPSKWVDEEDAEEFERLRKILRNGLGQLNSGFPPELLYAGGKMSYLMMKHGVRKFAEYATAMIEELGDAIRPHLKSLYNFTRSTEEVMESEWADELTPFDEVMKFDTANFGKPNVDAMATAENVVAEEASQQHLEDAVNTIKDSIRQNPDGSTSQTINEGGTEIEVTEGDFIPGVYPPIDDKPTKPGKKKPSKSKPTEQKPTTGQLDLFEEKEEQIINDIIDDTTPPEPKPEAELSGDSADYQERTRQERDLVDDIVIEIMKRTDMRERGDEKVTLTMRDIRGMLENYSLLADISATDLQELVERAMTILTRTAAKTYQLDPRKGYDRVVAYYNMQPSLNARDSERLIKQQYSTPTPFGYVMGQFVNAKNDAKSILEPSAGNGALTIMFDPATVHVNDIDERRLENLRTLGYGTVTAQNGLLPFEGEKVDGVLTNPPFGSVTEKVYDGVFKISSLEGQMAINALDSMKDGGRAAIIIGGNTSYRTNGSMNPKDAAFFGYLYSHYNVADVINISGKALYARNGTGYDVRMILINGRKTGEFSRVYPPVKSKARAEQVTTFDELYKRVQDDIQQVFQVGHKPTDEKPEGDRAADGGTSTPVRSGSNLPNQGAGERPDTTGNGSGSASGSHIEQPSFGNGGSRPVGVDNGDTGNAGGSDNVQRSQSSASGSNESGSPQNDGGRSGGNGRDATSSRPNSSGERLAVKPDLTTEKVPYPNQSDNGFTLLSVVPAAQAEVLQRSLAEIGDVDQFLVDELGYSSKEELYSYLAAEQIDSVALAIHQMNKGNAFIIGDMTGVGKGRQGAALIRYGVRQGRCPIYFTQKPTLFTDNYRDLADIGSSELRPFIIASNPKDANIVDANGNVVHKLPSKKEQERVFDYIMQNGKLPKEYDYVLTTYDQIKNGTADYSQNEDGTWNTEARKLPKKSKGYTTADYNGQARRDALARLAMGVAPGEGNIAILDESHTVGGDSGCGRYMQMLTSGAYGVTFLSATFAKRADNMPIYAQRTAIAEAGVNANELIEAIAKGGVTLQEIMSKQLVESGQMIRRERSFEGVTIDWLSVEEETDRKQREQFNEVADIFNSIRNFQNDFIKPIIDGMNEDAAETGGTVGQTQGTKDMGVRNTPFASKMYNLVNQLLFALKVDAVADRVIENLRNGFKPVISFTNTMEGFLASAPKGVAMDEVPNFSLTLMRALDGVMRFTENDADQNSEGGQITVGQLSPEGQAAYNAIKGKIMNLSADLPISPMDAIRMKIEEAGYTVAEITGRTTQLNRTEDGRYIVEGRKDRDKKAAMRDFNAGKLDVLMINKSGSTGISLHASSKFEDQRQRVMVFAQFQSDINDEVQMRGRIDRSGQVVRGRYEYIMSTIPAEQRIQMMFKAKLKSLDANTTSSQKSKFNEMEIVDYLNKYGDEVVWEYMKEHPELSDRLGDPLKMLQDKDEDGAARTSEKEDSSQKSDCAGKISRYLAFLSVEEQDEIFKEITEAYKVKIQLLDDAGENDLEITTMPLRAETKSKQIWHNGENPGSGNAFADNTYVEEVEVDVLKKPMKRTEIEDMTRKLMGDKITTATKYDQTRYGMKDGELNWGRYADKKIEEVNNFFRAKADDAVAKMKEAGESRVSKAREKSVKDALKARAKGENTFSDQEIEALADVVAKEAQDKEEMKQYRRREEINNVRDQIKHLLSRLRAGHIYVVPQDLKQATADMFTQTFGTFVGFKFNKSYTLGSSTAIFATLDGRRKVELALNDKAIETIIRCTDTALRYSPKEINAISMDNWDSKVPTKTRQTRHIITGNLLQALVDTEKGEKTKGNLISFSTNDGNTRQGILMSENFKPTDLRSSVPLRSRLKQIQDGITVVSENGDVQIERVDFDWKHRGEYELKVPKSKQRGGIYSMHTDLLKLIDGHNFNSKGNYMIGYILPENLAKVVDMLSRAPFNLTVLEESKLTEAPDSSQRNVEDDSDLRFRIREEEPPKQTGVGYEPQKRQTGAITDEQINELNSQFAQRERGGYGAYSDAEVSMENDPWSKAWGESIRTKRQQKQFAERERKRMRDRAKSLSSVLGIDIEVIEDASSLKGKNQRAKGWYDTKTGKITVVVGNHNSAADMEATILHEAVAHHGLRQLLGEHFDEFLDKVYEAADNGIKEQIDLLASRNGWDRRVATEEYLAGLAEETEFDRAEERVGGWFDKIKRFFIDMLFKAGFKHIKPGSIGDNELRYILWRSYQNLANPGRYRAFEWEAEDVAMQYKLQIGQYDTTSEKVESAADSGIRFRDGDFTPRDRKLAADVYEKMLSRGSWQFREATQDSMLGLKTLYESILGSNTRIENVAGHENAYLYENRMSSANNGEQHQYFSRFMKPLLDCIHKLCGSKELDRRILTDYMMAKHGLERNEYMRNEAAANGEDTERDFAGLCGLTGEDDWQVAETVAQQMVDDYESDHDTAELWNNVKKATNATLEKIYLSGLISEDTYNKVLGMYDFYIPLRGWDETTSDEVYGYLTSKDGPLMGNVFKTAEGRESKADDPIATIAMMADDAIRQGNRNIMKQRFLNFVHGNPSDLVSVNEMWLQHNDVTDEWEPVFADLQPDMTHAEVESEIAKFEAKMEALRTSEPDKYKKGRDARNIPYKVVRGNLNEHQVLVKRNGRTYVMTINGNPRAAQALNGLTNPNVEVGGVIGDLLKLGEYVNRHLSAFYTTRNPDFVVSNFMRDMLYSNCMTWVKENPRYALRFHKNFGKVNPLTLRRLLSKWENDNLSDSNYLEKMFKEFMLNGGETGYTSVKDIEGHKRTIAKELKKLNKRDVGNKAWRWLGGKLDLLNRSAENCARFAAFLTSREMGRTLDRSIHDAKEVSVNFNKKGSGGKFVHANGQKLLGKIGSYLGGGGRIAFVFWNAGIQGMTNFGRAGKRNPGKAIGGAAALFTLGYVIPLLAQMLGGGDGDDDDKNAYYNLPEYVRRSNICFKAGEQWITIPLPIEYRAIYGMGELACGVISGNERYSNSELAYYMAAQISQTLPLDFLEGANPTSHDGFNIKSISHPFIPSAFKPFTEAYIMNKGWTGLPVYKDTPYNKNDPEWTKAYQSADQHLVAFTRWLNETSGGDDYKKGAIDINPAKLEYLLSGTFGGAVSTTGKLKKMGETALGTREFEWRNMLLANRVIKSGDERTANRKLQNEYFKYMNEYEETNRLRKKYENAADDGILGYAERADFLYNSPEYLRFGIFEKYKPDIDAIREEIKEETNPEAKKELQEELFSTMRELVDELHDVGK